MEPFIRISILHMLCAVTLAIFGTDSGKGAALQEEVTSQLCSGKAWTAKAVDAYWTVNRQRLEKTASLAPELVREEVRLLASLSPSPLLSRLLETHPECTGLVLLAADRPALASAIMDAPAADQGMLIASYLFCTDNAEVDQWTGVVRRHAPIIATLQRRCAALPYQGLFAYLTTMRQPEARAIYGQWIDDVLTPAMLENSDDVLSSRMDFVGNTGNSLREKLEDVEAFRREFMPGVWPRLREAMVRLSREQAHGGDIYFLCGSDPKIWDFFRRTDAEKLFRSVGMTAVSALSEGGVADSAVRQAIVALWTDDIQDLPESLLSFQSDGNFCSLVGKLAKDEDRSLLNGACLRLHKKGADWPKEAVYLAKLSPAGLRRELHPTEPGVIPGAAMCSLVSKFIDGRRTSGTDWLGASMDAVDLVCLVGTMGGSAVVTESGAMIVKEGGRTMLDKMSKESATRVWQQTLRTSAEASVEKLTGRTVRELGRDGADLELAQVIGKEALRYSPELVRDTLIKGGLVEVSGAVRAGFRVTRSLGLDRRAFKMLTGMEARLFMRQDGRVFINLTRATLLKRSPAAIFMTNFLEDQVEDSEMVKHVKDDSATRLREWRENASAWWSGNATGQFDEAKVP